MAQAKWTFMVFIAGDNDLEGAGYNDIEEMKRVGSNANLNIVVQFDNMREEVVRRYYIKPGVAEVVQTLPETNTGDPQVLSDFISWAMTNYPAEHYLVDVWNHGTGWEDVPENYNYDNLRGGGKPNKEKLRSSIFFSTIKKVHEDEDNQRAIAIDVSARDFLDNQELQKALATVGRPIDVVGFDACLMNMLEVAYQLKGQAHYLVGSEELEPGPGWAYNKVLSILANAPDTSPRALAQQMVQKYAEAYKGTRKVTQSALDAAQLTAVAEAVDCLGGALKKHLDDVYRSLPVIRTQVQGFDNINYVDLFDLAELMKKDCSVPDVKNAAERVAALVAEDTDNRLVIENFHSEDIKFAHGISIYFPTQRDHFAPNYRQLDFIKDYPQWREFLETYVDYSTLR